MTDLDAAWSALTRATLEFYASGPDATAARGPRWFAADVVVRPVADPAEAAAALALMAEAHHVPLALVERTVRPVLAAAAAVPWIARLDDAPASVVWIGEADGLLVVEEMMTPQRFQRRGVGRALLSTALASSWRADVTGAALLSTVAGRRLYTSLGFAVADRSVTAHRGLDDDVLAAIGLPVAP